MQRIYNNGQYNSFSQLNGPPQGLPLQQYGPPKGMRQQNNVPRQLPPVSYSYGGQMPPVQQQGMSNPYMTPYQQPYNHPGMHSQMGGSRPDLSNSNYSYGSRQDLRAAGFQGNQTQQQPHGSVTYLGPTNRPVNVGYTPYQSAPQQGFNNMVPLHMGPPKRPPPISNGPTAFGGNPHGSSMSLNSQYNSHMGPKFQPPHVAHARHPKQDHHASSGSLYRSSSRTRVQSSHQSLLSQNPKPRSRVGSVSSFSSSQLRDSVGFPKPPNRAHTPVDHRNGLTTAERYKSFRSFLNLESLNYEPYTYKDYRDLKSRDQNMRLPKGLGVNENDAWQMGHEKRNRMNEYAMMVREQQEFERQRIREKIEKKRENAVERARRLRKQNSDDFKSSNSSLNGRNKLPGKSVIPPIQSNNDPIHREYDDSDDGSYSGRPKTSNPVNKGSKSKNDDVLIMLDPEAPENEAIQNSNNPIKPRKKPKKKPIPTGRFGISASPSKPPKNDAPSETEDEEHSHHRAIETADTETSIQSDLDEPQMNPKLSKRPTNDHMEQNGYEKIRNPRKPLKLSVNNVSSLWNDDDNREYHSNNAIQTDSDASDSPSKNKKDETGSSRSLEQIKPIIKPTKKPLGHAKSKLSQSVTSASVEDGLNSSDQLDDESAERLRNSVRFDDAYAATVQAGSPAPTVDPEPTPEPVAKPNRQKSASPRRKPKKEAPVEEPSAHDETQSSNGDDGRGQSASEAGEYTE